MPKTLFVSASAAETSSDSGVPSMLARSTGLVESGLFTSGPAETTFAAGVTLEPGWIFAGSGAGRKLNAGTWLAGVQLSMPSFHTSVSAGSLFEARWALSSDSLIGPFCSLSAA